MKASWAFSHEEVVTGKRNNIAVKQYEVHEETNETHLWKFKARRVSVERGKRAVGEETEQEGMGPYDMLVII